MNNKVYLVIDIGGTKIAWGLLNINNNLDNKLIYFEQMPYIKGKQALQQSIQAIIKKAETKARSVLTLVVSRT